MENTQKEGPGSPEVEQEILLLSWPLLLLNLKPASGVQGHLGEFWGALSAWMLPSFQAVPISKLFVSLLIASIVSLILSQATM